ncbi:MAG: DeoR/GlpR transcriptional regulator [Phycisphaeraceae bacterium]|nr:DeoR/GlpR transcriptional regulator [Phycisphaeraceae bacterium]
MNMTAPLSENDEHPNQEQRLDTICELVRMGGRIRVADLSRRFGVSEVTIRRDLQTLENAGRLVRTRGGAAAVGARAMPGIGWGTSETATLAQRGLMAIASTMAEQSAEGVGGDPDEPSFSDRLWQARAAKEAIGRAAAELLRPGDSVILDTGSTPFVAAKHLHNLQRLTVVTNSIAVILELVDAPGIEVLALGGVLDRRGMEFSGASVTAQLEGLRVRLAFLGADGLSVERGAQASSAAVVQNAGLMASHAQEVVVLADASKLGQEAFGAYLPTERIHTLITAGPWSERAEEETRRLREHGVRVIRADESDKLSARV